MIGLIDCGNNLLVLLETCKKHDWAEQLELADKLLIEDISKKK